MWKRRLLMIFVASLFALPASWPTEAEAGRGRGFSRSIISDLRRAYRLIFAQEGTLNERLDDVAELFSDNEPVMEIVHFIRAESSRAICQPRLDDAA